MSNTWLAALAALGAVLAAVACGNASSHSPGAAKEAATAESPAQPSPQPEQPAEAVLRLEERMVKNVRIEPVRERRLPVTLTATGKVHFNEDQMARIVVPVSGQVQQLSVKIGDAVRKDQRLFAVNSREVAAAITEHLENERDLELSEKQFAMAKDLFEHQAGSRIAMQQAESDMAKNKARVARSEEALRILGLHHNGGDHLDSRIPILTPLAGTVIERKVTDGQFVQPESAALITIADMSTLWVLADIFERDLHSVRTGQRAVVTTEAYPDRKFTARVGYLGDVVDPESRTVKVRFVVSNPASETDARLKPEMFATVQLFLDEGEKALCVPDKAIFIESGRHYVFVETSPGAFVRREVETAAADDGWERITGGAQAGERVVTAGALLLRQMEMRK